MTVAAAVMLATGLVSAGQYDAYGYKAAITFSGYNKSETLTNFPALVVLSNNCFSGFAYSQLQSGSNDLAFTADAVGTMNLNYEIDTWNTNGASYVWVQVPALASSTTITAWWSATGVTAQACTTNGATWTNGYVGVWHLNSTADSSANINNGANVNATATTAGYIAGGYNFNGSSAYIQLPLSSSLALTGSAITIEAWIRQTGNSTGTANGIVGRGNALSDNTYDFGFEIRNDNKDVRWFTRRLTTTDLTSPNAIPANVWVYMTATYDGATKNILANGLPNGSTSATGTLGTSPDAMRIGYSSITSDGNNYFNGQLDEVRLSKVSRSANWVWACYLNMASNRVFNTYGAAGQVNASQPQITDGVSQNVLNTSADVVGTLVANGSEAATVHLYWSTTDGTTNASLWTTGGGSVSNLGASFADGATFTNTLTGLASNTIYYWNYSASNSSGTVWGGPAAGLSSLSFKTMGPPGVNNDGGAGSIGPYSATLRGTLTNGVSASATVYCGTDPNNWTYTNALGTITEAQGVFSANQTGLARNSAYYYSVLVSNQYGTAQSPATNFTTLPYVWITANTTCFENQTNQWAGAPVVVDGAGVVLTLSNSATYGTLPVYAFGNLIVTNGASVVCLSQGSMSPYTITNRGVAIQSAGDVIVAGGSSINADGTGFPAGAGPGGSSPYGLAYCSGTYGGRCPTNPAATYGSATNPVCLGSGGQGANGGGAVKLIVTGNLIVNGRLSANGLDNGYGGGAGGSIWMTGGCTLGGTGEGQVSGGNTGGYLQYASGGGGGRLSIDDTVTDHFHGNIRGANGNQINCYGGAGSVYFGALARQDFIVFSNQTIVIGNDIANVFGNLTVYGTLVPAGSYAGQGSGVVIRATSVTIAASGSINADSWGLYPGPAWLSGAGGTHAGLGESSNANVSCSNTIYGSATAPTSMGSGGGGNYGAVGGGAFELIVSGNLNVLGSISANGPQGGYTGGAGGGIWIDAGTLSGNGSIRANGAASNQGTYRGGGGRIAVYYHSASTFTGLPAPGLYTNLETISSTVTVKGGYNIGANGPEDGSLYIVHVVPQGTMVLFR